jgi:hypothetical protein
VPHAVLAADSKVEWKVCDGSAGPGRCIPLCFALVKNPASAFFPMGEAGCGTEEVCVPCLSPLDGSDTQACDDGCAP